MSKNDTVRAHLVGNPFGGELDNPWTFDPPTEGERVALFLHDVTAVDGAPLQQRGSYHAMPADRAETGPLGPAILTPQGVTVQWWACGTAVVVGTGDEPLTCQVRADDPHLLDPGY